MLCFKTTSAQLAEMNLGTAISAGTQKIYIHDGTVVTGVSKVFQTGDSAFAYEGCAMTYYYNHGSPQNKVRDTATSVTTLWGDYRILEANLLKGDNLQRFQGKYPIIVQAMMNTFYARTGKHDMIEAPFYLDRLSSDVVDYGLIVPFPATQSVKMDLQQCNFVDVKQACQATQLLLNASMGLDQEVNSDEAQFFVDMLKMSVASGR